MHNIVITSYRIIIIIAVQLVIVLLYYIMNCTMHLSMSSPAYPRSGRGGNLQMLDDKFPTPGDSFDYKSPTNSYYLSQKSLTIWPSMAIRVANAPTLGTS